MAEAFRFRMRVRFHECDGQKVVFNSRYGEYVDVAALEFSRALWGSVVTGSGGEPPVDWRLVKQEMQWKSPAVFDDIIEISVTTNAVGTTSFTWQSELTHAESGRVLACAKTVYVFFDSTNNTKRVIDEEMRQQLWLGAPDVLTDCSGLIR